MATIFGWLMLALYIYLPFLFLRGSLKKLVAYFRDEKREYDIVTGSIVAIEKQIHNKAKGGRSIRYYAVYRFSYGGKSYRRYSYRLPVRIGPGLKTVVGTKLAEGNPVQVRVFRPDPEGKVDSRIEEPFYFWKARLWVHIPAIVISALMIGYGLYSAYLQLMYIL